MAVILFFPHPEFGHVNPPLKLARGLKLEGHTVYYVGLADFEDYVRSQGLDYISIFEDRCPKGYLKNRAGEKKQNDLDNLTLLLWEATGGQGKRAFDPIKEIEAGIAKVLRKTSPDLMIIDFKLRDLAPLVIHKFGLHAAIISVTLIDLAPITTGRDEAPSQGGLPELFLCPKEFDFPSVTKRDRYYIEASIELQRKESHAFPWDKVDADRPLIYCSLGSQSYQYEHNQALYRAVIEAMKGKPDWQLVLAAGMHSNPIDFNPLPENVLVVNWAPQLELIKRASIMITHGGLGGVKECIFFGVPMIVFPCRWDQPHNAARVVYHGLGVRGDIHNVSVSQIRSLIDTIEKNPSFRMRVEAMGEVFREIEGSGVGVKTVERILADYRDGVRTRAALRPSRERV
jgi:UDP:flavonoid glycosyltransferase YjiC (YdhE family)